MTMPNRKGGSNYRYGFNGMEGDDEVKGGGNSLIVRVGDDVIDFSSRLTKLKGCDVFGGCIDYASDFMKILRAPIESAGGTVKRFSMNIGKNGFIGIPTQAFSDNGYHEFIEVVVDGKTMIFDNLNPKGVLKEDYIKTVFGVTADGVELTGKQLLESATEIK